MGATPLVVPMPRWSTGIGCARVIIAMLVLAFTAAASAIWGPGYTAFGFTLFTSSATLLIFIYYYVSLCPKPEFYNRWVILGLEIFGVVFWLISFALLAEWTAVYNGHNYWYGDGDSYGFWNAPYSPSDVNLKLSKRAVIRRSHNNKYRAGVALAGTAAGLGAIEFVLFGITLTVFGISLHKQKKNAIPSTVVANPASSANEPAADICKAEQASEDKTNHSDTV